MEGQPRNTDLIHTIQDEDLLWNRFQNGDKVAFHSIYQKYVDKLYNYGTKVCKESSLIKDCIQDLFIDLWTSRESLSNTVRIEYYLFKSLRRKILAKLQKDKKAYLVIQQFVSNEDVEVKSIENEIISETRKFELRSALSKELDKLPERQREILFLIFHQGYTYEESSSLMNVDIKTAYNLAWRGIKKIKSSLV